MRLRLVVGFQALQWVVVLGLAQAQAQTQPLPELPPPPPPAASGAPEAGAAPAPEGGAEACVPQCRAGFMCQRGVCISACNPPCPAGQECTAQGQCAYPYAYPQQQQVYPVQPMYPPPPAPIYERPTPPPPPPGSYMHDGFFLHGGFGIGFTATEQSPAHSGSTYLDSNFTGVAIALNVDVGFAPATNFILQARFGLLLTPDPRISVEGSDDSISSDFSLGTLLVAPAITYYFMPINLYLTGAVGLAWFTFDADRTYDYDGDYEYDDNSDITTAGIGLNFDVGKEWWVGRQWGIGVAARMSFAAASGSVVSGRYDYTQWGFGVLFSATLQ